MFMDFKSFSSDERNNKPQENVKEDTVTESDVRTAIGKFSQMSNDDLMVELVKQIAIQKNKGNTDNVKSTITKIKPLLNAEQQARLADIVTKLDI